MSDNTLDLVLHRLDAVEAALKRAGIGHNGGPTLDDDELAPDLPHDPLTARTEAWLSRREQARRWGVSIRSIERWGEDPKLGLPEEIEINGRFYRALSKIERFERSRVKRAI